MSGPAYHARTHLPGGTDPIQAGSAGAVLTYRDCVLADSTTVNFWPMNDASGNLVDIGPGADDLAAQAHSGWPVYQSGGPFPALPSQTAVENGGATGIPSASSQSRFDGLPAFPSGTTPFTLQGWLYVTSLTFGGTVWATNQIYMDYSPTTGAMSISRGGGAVHLTGAVLPVATWTHIRLDYDGTTLRLFQDFALLDTDTQGSIASGGPAAFMNVVGGSINWAPMVGRAAMWSLHNGIASTCVPTATGGTDAPEFYGAWADGVGGVSWHLVQTDNIDDEAVGTDQIAPLAVTQALIANDAVGNAQIADDAVANAQIADDAVDTAQIADNAVTSAQIAAGAIVDADVNAAAAIAVTKLAAGTDGQVLLTSGSTPTWGSVAAAVEAAGRWELVMEDGVTAPPVPVETEAQDDWVYAWIAG